MSGKHDQVAQVFADRLAGIRQSAGFHTDIGARVYRGKGKRAGDEPYLVLFEDEESVLNQSGKGSSPDAACTVRVPYIIEAQAPAADPDNPNPTGHLMADDICRALWSGADYDRALLAERPAYAGRQILAREEGQVLVVVQVKFNATFVFNLGNP